MSIIFMFAPNDMVPPPDNDGVKIRLIYGLFDREHRTDKDLK